MTVLLQGDISKMTAAEARAWLVKYREARDEVHSLSQVSSGEVRAAMLFVLDALDEMAAGVLRVAHGQA
jgi:hypothetical protein